MGLPLRVYKLIIKRELKKFTSVNNHSHQYVCVPTIIAYVIPESADVYTDHCVNWTTVIMIALLFVLIHHSIQNN